MNTLKQKLLTNWHLMRVVRLLLGLWMLVMAVQTKDWAIGLFSAFFIYTALLGVGCCGAQGCYTSETDPGENKLNDIEYEEVK